MKIIKAILELISFFIQIVLCLVIVGISLPFIIIKVTIQLLYESIMGLPLLKKLKI